MAPITCQKMSDFFLTTQNNPTGHRIVENFGLVRGNTIRTKHIGRDIMAGFKTLVGGEIKSYTSMLNEAREEALMRMQEDAKNKGANAVIGVRFSTSAVLQGAAELLAYGTAVKLEKEQK